MTANPVLVSSGRYIDPNAPLAKQVEMIRTLIHQPSDRSHITVFTPALASWVLQECNSSGNRKRKPLRIKRYAEAMEHDDWVMTGEPIIFGKTGKLLDGQNRLAACVRAVKKFRTHVVFGIDDKVFTAINSGKARTPSDTFYTAGISDHEVVSPAVRWIMIYEAGNPAARASYSNQEMFEFYKEHIDQDALTLAVSRAKMANKTIPRGALAAHFYLFEKSNAASARRLALDFDKNRGGARKLTTTLTRARKNNQSRLHDTWINAILVQVWNAYRANELVTARHLKWNDTKEYPAIA